LLLSLAIG